MPTQVKLSDIIDALDSISDEAHSFVNLQTGHVITVTDEEIQAAEDEEEDVEDDEDLPDVPDWQREAIEQARAIQADDGGRFLELPGKFDINEWDMMRDFARSQSNPDHADSLLNAISGRGAFRYFKDRLHELGLAVAWYKFRDEQYRQVAVEWCEANGITAV